MHVRRDIDVQRQVRLLIEAGGWRLGADATVQHDLCMQDCAAHHRMCEHDHVNKRKALEQQGTCCTVTQKVLYLYLSCVGHKLTVFRSAR